MTLVVLYVNDVKFRCCLTSIVLVIW